MIGKLAVAGLLLAAAPAMARDADEALDVAAQAVQDTLNDADAAVARAAEDLGRTGITGKRAHARLQSLCDELTWAVACSTIDREGALVNEAPAPFAGLGRQDVSDQAAVRRVLDTREPGLSDLFTSAEGIQAISLLHPIHSRGGRFLGAVSVLARPEALIGHAVKPAFPGDLPEVVVSQLDGTQVYETDREEIGRNVLTDPLYDDYPEVREAARTSLAEREGSAEFRFLGRGLTPPVRKTLHWTTVSLHGTEWRVAILESLEGAGPEVVRYDEPAIPIPAEVGLDALVALADAHVAGIAEDLELIAARDDVRSGEWARVEEPLRLVAEANPDGVYWFALPDGSYWTVDGGKARGTLAERPSFQEALAGERVVGDLAVSSSTGRSTGVVAIPLKGADGETVGVLGASIFLDRLSARLRDQMGLDEGLWFYAFDEAQRLALYPDPERVFLRAGELGPEVEQWFTEMQQRGEGVMRYTYEGRPRTLVFKRSDVTGWTYAFGFVGEREEAS